MKNIKGITLVSLVVTIIVLIILAGVGINLTIGKNGILNKAKFAKEETKSSQNEENQILDSYEATINKVVGNEQSNKYKLKRVSLGETSGTSRTRTFDASSIPNYQNLTIDNFAISTTYITSGASAGTNSWITYSGYRNPQYNNETGIFQFDLGVYAQPNAIISDIKIKCECIYVE